MKKQHRKYVLLFCIVIAIGTSSLFQRGTAFQTIPWDNWGDKWEDVSIEDDSIAFVPSNNGDQSIMKLTHTSDTDTNSYAMAKTQLPESLIDFPTSFLTRVRLERNFGALYFVTFSTINNDELLHVVVLKSNGEVGHYKPWYTKSTNINVGDSTEWVDIRIDIISNVKYHVYINGVRISDLGGSVNYGNHVGYVKGLAVYSGFTLQAYNTYCAYVRNERYHDYLTWEGWSHSGPTCIYNVDTKGRNDVAELQIPANCPDYNIIEYELPITKSRTIVEGDIAVASTTGLIAFATKNAAGQILQVVVLYSNKLKRYAGNGISEHLYSYGTNWVKIRFETIGLTDYKVYVNNVPEYGGKNYQYNTGKVAKIAVYTGLNSLTAFSVYADNIYYYQSPFDSTSVSSGGDILVEEWNGRKNVIKLEVKEINKLVSATYTLDTPAIIGAYRMGLALENSMGAIYICAKNAAGTILSVILLNPVAGKSQVCIRYYDGQNKADTTFGIDYQEWADLEIQFNGNTRSYTSYYNGQIVHDYCKYYQYNVDDRKVASFQVYMMSSTNINHHGWFDWQGLTMNINSPSNLDTDNDGLTDEQEITLYHSNSVDPDTDRDGLLDYQEVNLYSTSPNAYDTDGDSFSDYHELEIFHSNPLDNWDRNDLDWNIGHFERDSIEGTHAENDPDNWVCCSQFAESTSMYTDVVPSPTWMGESTNQVVKIKDQIHNFYPPTPYPDMSHPLSLGTRATKSVVKFDFGVTSKDDFWIKIGNSGKISMILDVDNFNVYFNDGTTFVPLLTYSYNTMYHIEIRIYHTEKIYDVFLNDIVTPIANNFHITNLDQPFDEIEFRGGTWDGAFYFDNIIAGDCVDYIINNGKHQSFYQDFSKTDFFIYQNQLMDIQPADRFNLETSCGWDFGDEWINPDGSFYRPDNAEGYANFIFQSNFDEREIITEDYHVYNVMDSIDVSISILDETYTPYQHEIVNCGDDEWGGLGDAGVYLGIGQGDLSSAEDVDDLDEYMDDAWDLLVDIGQLFVSGTLDTIYECFVIIRDLGKLSNYWINWNYPQLLTVTNVGDTVNWQLQFTPVFIMTTSIVGCIKMSNHFDALLPESKITYIVNMHVRFSRHTINWQSGWPEESVTYYSEDYMNICQLYTP